MFCSKCGKEVENDEWNCTACGHEVRQTAVEEVMNTPFVKKTFTLVTLIKTCLIIIGISATIILTSTYWD